jgi:flap endonuclease-1
LIREHGTLEKVVESIENDSKKRYTIPDDWPYQEARELFLNPDVRSADHPDCDFKWEAPDVEGLVKFLVHEKGFNEDRVRSAATKLQKNVKTAQQSRLEGFFKSVPKTEEEKASHKRKHEEKIAESKKKKKEEAKTKKEGKSKVHLNT